MSAKIKKKVLVIDDDPFAYSQIAQSLEARGFEVITVSEPDEAVEKAKEIVPDLVFCSLVLPVSNGLKIIKSIHSIESLKKVPSVMLISYAGELDPKYTAPLGIVDVIVKPLNPKEIVSKTLKVLGEDTGVIKIIAKEPPLKKEKEYEEFTLEDEPETFEIKEEELIMESGESIEPLEAEIVDQAPEDDFSKLFEESPEEDVTQEYKPEELGSVSTAFPDKTPDIGEVEEEFDIPEKDTSVKADETREFLSEEDIQEKEFDMYEEEKYPPRGKKDPVKKIAIITASVITIAVLSFGALKIFQKDKGKEIPIAVQKETQPEKSPLTKETVKETIPMDEKKTKEIALETVDDKSEKKNIPTKAVEKPDKPEQQKSVQKKPAEKKESKAPTEKMKDLYSVQVGVFESEKNAGSFADKFKQKGYDVFIKKESSEKKTLYRVLIGKYSENKKAVEQSKVILQKEGSKSIVYHH